MYFLKFSNGNLESIDNNLLSGNLKTASARSLLSKRYCF